MSMNQRDIQQARRARLFHQTQILQDGDAGADVDTSRAPAVLRDIGVPPKLVEATFAASKFTQVGAVRDWFVEFNDGVTDEYLALFLGDASNYTAAALLRNAVKKGMTVAWYSWHDFAGRYTQRIDRSQMLRHADSPEDSADVIYGMAEAEEEDARLLDVYEVLVIAEFDIDDVRDFAVPDICALLRHRLNFELATVITVPVENCEPLSDRNTKRYGARGALLRLFDAEGLPFDGR
jgi:hypothetical protein